MSRRWTSRWTGPVSAALILVLAVAALFTAYGYSRSSGLFPVFIGWIFVALAVIEAGLQIRRVLNPAFREPADAETGLVAVDPASAAREVAGIAWLGVFVLAVWVFGFVLATPLFLFAFLRLAGRRPFLYAALAAVAATGIVYGVFALLLEYRLFPGLIFGA